MTTYNVTVTRDNGVWFADVDGLPSHYIGATDVLKFADLELEVRDLIAGLTQTEPGDFHLGWKIMFGDTDVYKVIDELQHVIDGIRRLEAQRDELRHELIREGRNAHLPQSALADVLGLSQQRVAQLASF